MKPTASVKMVVMVNTYGKSKSGSAVQILMNATRSANGLLRTQVPQIIEKKTIEMQKHSVIQLATYLRSSLLVSWQYAV